MVVSPLEPSHYLVLTYCAWGHTRPLLSLALTLLLQHPHLQITVLVYGPLREKVDAEIAGWKLNEEQKGRLKVVRFGGASRGLEGKLIGQGEVGDIADLTVKSFAESYYKMLKLEPLLDSCTNELVPSFPRQPSLTIIDATITVAFLPHKLSIEKSVWGAERRTATFTFHPASSSYVGFTFFKDSLVPELVAKGMQELKNEEGGGSMSAREVYDGIYLKNDTLAPVIGLEPMYMFEHEPSRCHPLDRWLLIMHGLQQLYASRLVDGTIVSWPGELSHGVQEAASGTFDDDNFLQVGPLLSPSSWDRLENKSFRNELESGDEVMNFLDQSEERSVLFISFGSIFFPPTLRHAETLMETLLELKIRFIVTKGNGDKEVVEMFERMVSRSEGRGLLAGWIPQQALLAHKSLSFFLTHAGSNSVTESLVNGAPMIAWPGCFDQPLIASELTLTHQVAFELVQVRQGTNIGKRLARGTVVEGTEEAVRREMREVFGRMQGVEGEKMRGRAQKLSEVIRTSRASGMSFEALERLGRFA